MSWHQHGPGPEERNPHHREEYEEHYPVPQDSGTASSFASRHNEFPPEQGHESAAHDPKTGAPVHGDGTPNEELPAQWQHEDGAPEEEVEP